jgi:hypothetical protein
MTSAQTASKAGHGRPDCPQPRRSCGWTLCKRAAALEKLTKADVVAAVKRNPFACILAPVLGAASGGSASAPLLAVAMIGILAAIAVPNFIKYQERVRQAQSQGLDPAAAATAVLRADTPSVAALTAEDRASLDWVKEIRRRIADQERARGTSSASRKRAAK